MMHAAGEVGKQRLFRVSERVPVITGILEQAIVPFSLDYSVLPRWRA